MGARSEQVSGSGVGGRSELGRGHVRSMDRLVRLRNLSMHLTTPAFFGTYQKGRKAAREGLPKHACPYEDKRGGQYDHIITWSRSFMSFWEDGWDDETTGKPDRYSVRPRVKANTIVSQPGGKAQPTATAPDSGAR